VKECVASLLNSTYFNYKIVVLDNASGDQSIQKLENWIATEKLWEKIDASQSSFLATYQEDELRHEILPAFGKITLIQNLYNEGFAAGNNVILKYIKQEDAYVWLLNPDMIVDPTALEELVRYTGSQTFRSITGAVLKKYENPSEVYLYGGGQINWRTATIRFITDLNDLGKIDYLNGSCIFLYASHFEDLGLLPTRYFLYWEETAWCYNAKQAGYKINVCLTAICYDKISATIGKSYLSDFYYTRNGLLFVQEYSKTNLKFAKFSTLLRIGRRLMAGQFDRAKGTISGLKAFYKMEQNEDK
jgi:GT2 family glycosyltransferase